MTAHDDCLVEVTANFYQKGDHEADPDGLHQMWLKTVEDTTVEIKHPEKYLFSEDNVGFDFNVVSESNDSYGCGLQHEILHAGVHDIFGPISQLLSDEAAKLKDKPETKTVRLIVAVRMTYDVYDDEGDSSLDVLGVIKMADIVGIAKGQRAATGEKVNEAKKALTCLHIAVEESIARDVEDKVLAAFDELKSKYS